TSTDGALVVAAAGHGRVAITFDRNTFFNANGVGSQLSHLDNARYAQNLFEWLAGIFASTPQVPAPRFCFDTEPFRLRFAFNANVSASIGLADITVRNLTTGTTIVPASVSWDSSNNAAVFQFASVLPIGNYTATLKGSGISDGTHTLAADFV